MTTGAAHGQGVYLGYTAETSFSYSAKAERLRAAPAGAPLYRPLEHLGMLVATLREGGHVKDTGSFCVCMDDRHVDISYLLLFPAA